MDRVAIAFNNKLGNFIYMTSAVKILRQWGYKEIDLITDQSFLSSPAEELTADVFDNVVTEYDEEAYDRIFRAEWSVPMNAQNRLFGGFDQATSRNVDWNGRGIHEVQVYLNMIGASWEDFDGYILYLKEVAVLNPLKSKFIALANCSGSDQANLKGWPKFPELSEVLSGLGYNIILVGAGDELKGCKGHNFVGSYSIKETADIIRQCDLLIASSTGLAIVADAVGTPVIQLDGPIPSTKTHPLLVDYSIVRSYISCAPCFQSLLFTSCKDPICMKNIQVDKVINATTKMLSSPPVKGHFFGSYQSPKSDVPDCDDRVAYLIACFNRYHVLYEFLANLEHSSPQKGEIFFLNDASSDPRIETALKSFHLDDIKIHYLETDYKEKLALLRRYKKMPSAHAYNRLFREAFKMHEKDPFDFIMILDPDSIMHDRWIQKMIVTYREAKKLHPNIGLFSGFNNENHPIYDNEETKEIYRGTYSDYRLRNGVNLQFMFEPSFFPEHGFYDLETEHATLSSDLPKNEMLTKKGFKSMILVPSMLQQIGAYDSALPRRRSNEVAKDF